MLGTHTPSMAISYYKKEFPNKNAFAPNHRKAFNLEKETKIINPHKMELQTTTKEVYQGKQDFRAEAKLPIKTLKMHQNLTNKPLPLDVPKLEKR